MVRARVYGILAGYEDQHDHDTLRSDPVFKLIADRSPDDPDLASQPTLSRFENAISIKSLKRLRDVLLDQFIAEPLPEAGPAADTPPTVSEGGEAPTAADGACVPAEALAGAERRRHFRLRRQRDPLGEGHQEGKHRLVPGAEVFRDSEVSQLGRGRESERLAVAIYFIVLQPLLLVVPPPSSLSAEDGRGTGQRRC